MLDQQLAHEDDKYNEVYFQILQAINQYPNVEIWAYQTVIKPKIFSMFVEFLALGVIVGFTIIQKNWIACALGTALTFYRLYAGFYKMCATVSFGYMVVKMGRYARYIIDNQKLGISQNQIEEQIHIS